MSEQFTVTDEYIVTNTVYSNIQYTLFELAHLYPKIIFTAISVFWAFQSLNRRFRAAKEGC